jgi:transcriptional regulator PpsR
VDIVAKVSVRRHRSLHVDTNALTTPAPGAAPALPDITLRLDARGVIQSASFANGVADEPEADWVGRDWSTTVGAEHRDSLSRLLATLEHDGGAASARIEQRLPSGRLLPVDYTAIRVGVDQGIVAVGRHSRAVAELQSRLLDAQRTIERDYWKLRAVETRYRLLFDATDEALITLESNGLRMLELNPRAAELLGMTARDRAAGRGADLRGWLAEGAQPMFERLLDRVRDQGRAPAMLLELAGERPALLVRASRVGSGSDGVVLLQATPAEISASPGGGVAAAASDRHGAGRADVIQAGLIERSPDGHLIIDPRGRILRANAAFVEMAQSGSESAVLGESFGRWLGRPGADLAVLLANVERFGSVRLLATRIVGSLDSETEVELSAVGDRDGSPRLIGVTVRDVGRRLPASAEALPLGESCAGRVGRTPLRTLVEETVAEVERTSVEAALALTGGNRTAAAQLLGISRQSLHSKILRHGIGADAAERPDHGAMHS